ncbi:hypothetical protein [Micromonospora violae]|nr:hypothetical protein [Micromonospora violae]
MAVVEVPTRSRPWALAVITTGYGLATSAHTPTTNLSGSEHS